MSKIYWTTATFSDDGGAVNPKVLSGVLTEGIEIVEEDERVAIEDNQEIVISYKGGFTLESRNTSFDSAGGAVLSDTRINTDGVTKGRIVLSDGTNTATIDSLYINGRIGVISSGEVGVKLDGARSAATDPVTHA